MRFGSVLPPATRLRSCPPTSSRYCGATAPAPRSSAMPTSRRPSAPVGPAADRPAADHGDRRLSRNRQRPRHHGAAGERRFQPRRFLQGQRGDDAGRRKAILLAASAAEATGEEAAQRAIGGFTEGGHFVAFIDGGGAVEAASTDLPRSASRGTRSPPWSPTSPPSAAASSSGWCPAPPLPTPPASPA